MPARLCLTQFEQGPCVGQETGRLWEDHQLLENAWHSTNTAMAMYSLREPL